MGKGFYWDLRLKKDEQGGVKVGGESLPNALWVLLQDTPVSSDHQLNNYVAACNQVCLRKEEDDDIAAFEKELGLDDLIGVRAD